MSLYRFVYYSAVVGGWAAFLAWMVAQRPVLGSSWPGIVKTTVVGALVGAAVSAGLNLVSGMTNAQWKRLLKRLPSGLIGGGIGGAIGGLLGELMFAAVEFRALGWMIMGLAIGGVEGFSEGSRKKLRNGLIGGGLGGLLGGWLFQQIAVPDADMAARAAAFVILGTSIGALIGMTHVVLKEAWLTVIDGFRPGRELILSQTVTVLGRGDHLPLPLLGYAGRDLESEHAKITRKSDGSFSIEDNRSRLGTLLNAQRLQGLTTLSDGDLIKLGSNIIRFNYRRGGSRRAAAGPTGQAAGGAGKIAPPPPPAGSVPSAAPRPQPAPPQPAPPAAGPPPSPRPAPPGIPPGQIPAPGPPTQPGSPAPGPRIPPPPPPPGSN